jgi:hypothetical protein
MYLLKAVLISPGQTQLILIPSYISKVANCLVKEFIISLVFV